HGCARARPAKNPQRARRSHSRGGAGCDGFVQLRHSRHETQGEVAHQLCGVEESHEHVSGSAGNHARGTQRLAHVEGNSPVSIQEDAARDAHQEADQGAHRRASEGKGMSDTTVENLILDLLEWLGPEPRPYPQVMEAWRTSCPKLPVWEEANDRGFIEQC